MMTIAGILSALESSGLSLRIRESLYLFPVLESFHALGLTLVFGTIAAESQRMINETYSAFVQGFMPSLNRPDVDRLEGLTTAIVVEAER